MISKGNVCLCSNYFCLTLKLSKFEAFRCDQINQKQAKYEEEALDEGVIRHFSVQVTLVYQQVFSSLKLIYIKTRIVK